MIVVTGASGHVGGNLVRALLEKGRRVRALVHHDQRALKGLDVEIISADLTDPSSLEKAFRGAKVVYHLAGSISIRMDNWDELERINLTGTRNVVEACLRTGVGKLIHFSSIHAYQQEPFDQALDEDRPLLIGENHPPYERSKAAAELLVRNAPDRGLASVIIIPTAILGPHDYRPSYLGQALGLLSRGRIPMLVHGGYNWVDVRDVVQGAIQAELNAPSGARYILGGYWRNLQQFAQATAEISGKKAPRFSVPIWLAELVHPAMEKIAQVNGSQPLYTKSMLGAMRSNKEISYARAAHELGYAPRPFAETIADTLDWFAREGAKHK